MKNNDNHIDRLFREKLKNHEFRYRFAYWLKMKALLNNVSTGAGISTVSKIAGIAKWKFVTLIISATMITSTVFYFVLKNDKKENTITSKETLVETNPICPDKPIDTSLAETSTIDSSMFSNQNEEQKKTAENSHKYTHFSNTPDKNKIFPDNQDVAVNEPQIQYPDENKPVEKQSIAQSVDSANIQKKADTSLSQIGKNDTIMTQPTEILWAENKFISLNAGGTLMNSFTNIDSVSSGLVMTPFVGMTFHFPINDRYMFNVGATYLRSGEHQLERNSVRIRYFTYKEEDSIYLLTQKIDLVNFNFDLERKLHEKHFISGGLYVATRINTISQKTHVISNPFFYQSETTQEKGYYEGISTFSYGLSLAYHYHLMRNVYAGIRLNQTVNDMIDNKMFLSDRLNLITQINLYLKILVF